MDDEESDSCHVPINESSDEASDDADEVSLNVDGLTVEIAPQEVLDLIEEADDEISLNVDGPTVEIAQQEVPDHSNEESEQVNEEETLSESAAQINRGWSILRVPAHVREVENRAYSPKIVSIGPFHHNEPNLKAFENEKMRFLSRLFKNPMKSYEVLENAMKEMEGETRKCYSEGFEGINNEDFVRMMLLDGCFIVELLRLYTKSCEGNHDVEEPILETRWMVPNIGRDLLMLENQLPMFVLQKIFEITTLESKATPLNRLALQFFEPLRPGKDKLAKKILNAKGEHRHLLALFQSTFKAPYPRSHTKKDNLKKYDKIPGKGWVHNAKTLTFAGIRFRKKSGNFLGIEYKRRVLKIPTLFIDDGTNTLLRNLIAYEQSNRYVAPYFSCLAVFLDSIVDTADDINILRRAGIIKQPKGGDQEVVDLFNSLTKELEIDIDDCYIIKQIEEINRHYRSREAMVRLRLFLSAINFKGILSAYVSAVLTLIFILRHTSSNNTQPSIPSAAPPH